MPLFTYYRLIAGVFIIIHTSAVYSQNQPASASRDTLRLIAEEEERRLMDPILKRVPYERLDEARQQLNRKAARARAGIPNITWQERGPSNIGGRTRALLFDPNDATHKKVWAGSLSGGLWYTNDITDANAVWTSIDNTWENPVITALATDPSNPQIMYAGTGDTYDSQPGGGIWKTANGGTTWSRLSNTIPSGSAPAVSQAFAYIQRIVVNSLGKIFVATQYGVVQSSDGGDTWSYALAPGQLIGVGGSTANYLNDKVTDLEIGADGILYAGFNPSRVFKSNDATGTTWTEITPSGAAGGGRTELALALSTSGSGQILYGVSQGSSSTINQDLRWFKKSVDGGTTWNDMVIPLSWSGGFFTNGNASYSMALLVHPTDPNILYAGSFNWYRSTNGGATWSSNLIDTEWATYQHYLQFQPGSSGAVFCSSSGINWSPDWSQTIPTIVNRNSGYRTSEFYSVAMKAIAGDPYLIGGTQGSGAVKVTSPDPSSGFLVNSISRDMGLTFIDEDNPSMQILSSYYGRYQFYNGSSNLNYPLTINATALNPTDYDSQLNTLYGYEYFNGNHTIRKMTDITGTTGTITNLPLSGIASTPSFFKLSSNKQSMFIGTNNGQLYKVTSLSQTTPSVLSISNNTYLENGTVSCIDVGATDNELLVTYSNYGVKSVWYTSNGGANWTSKDESGYSLPDIPVRYALFNPQDRKQVLLATELGIWSTTDITVPNPDWQLTNGSIGNYRVNMLRYRASDRRLAAATYGRGLFTSDALLPSVTITNISNATLCAGNTFVVSFSTTGPAFDTGNKFDLWLSDANGSFANPLKIGSGTTSPISVTLPSGSNAVPYGTNYLIKIIATNPVVESSPSGTLAIGNLGSASVFDRRAEASQNWNSGIICPGGQATLKTYTYTTNYSVIIPESYQWVFNNIPISGATSITASAQQAGVYSTIVKQAGCTLNSNSYTLSTSTNPYSSVISSSSGQLQCDDRSLPILASYISETASYQWLRDGITISGATNYSYAATQTGNYTHTMTDGTCTFTSPSYYLQFGRSLFAQIHLAADSDSLLCGSYATILSTSATNGYSIQWYRNGAAISGATLSFYYPYQPGTYSISLSQGNCQTRSNAIVVRQSNQIKASINYSFKSKLVCPGESRYLYAFPSSYGSFQWQKDGVDITGATSSSYTATVSGSYTVRITKGSCSALSDPVSLTFTNAIQPLLTLAWSAAATGESCYDANPYVNDTYTLSGYQYQWYRNGVLLDGVTGQGIVTTLSGIYSVRVTNGSCSGLSKEIYVSNKNGKTSKSVVTISPTNAQLCQNNSLLLTASLYMGTLQWKRNGVAILGETRTQFYATQSGIYTVVNQDGSCSAESDPVEVKIGEATTATLSGNALISSGKSTLLPVSFTGPAPWSFTLTNGQSVTATYQNPTLIPVAPTNTTTYQLASVGNACGLGTVSGQASVSVASGSADLSLNMAVSNRTPNVGEVVTYTLTAANAGPDNAAGVQLSSLLPAGLAFVGTSSPGISFANGIVTANLETISATNQSVVSFQATPAQPGSFATSAQISSSQTPDPDSQPNSGTGDGQDDAVTVDIRTPADGSLITSANPAQVPLPVVSGNQPATNPNTADLSLAMWVDKEAPAVSDIVTTSLTVTNRGGSSAASIIVQVVLPNGSFNAQSPVGWIQVTGQTYKKYINLLGAGQSATVWLKWQPADSGTIQAQLFDADVADPDSTPGNGYTNGEDDEAIVSVRVR